jgi:hypothetical protein
MSDEQEKYVRVSVGFLGALVDYLKRQPYEEVHMFVGDIIQGIESVENPDDKEEKQLLTEE